MNYLSFKDCVISHLKDVYGSQEYEVNLRKICKNNGLRLDGLCIFKKGEHVSPTIYLNSYFEKYQQGKTISDILLLIMEEYNRGMENKPCFQYDCHFYEAVNRQIIMRLVNYEKNKEILEECPYIRYHDLAITFRWIAFQDEVGISSALISNHELEQWNITLSHLFEDAKENTTRLFPAEIKRLKDLLIDEEIDTETEGFDLYVLTNKQGINGASCILYDDLLKEFGESKQSNFYLLPSSIHEMMICLDEAVISPTMLLSLVREANHLVVTMGEVLSDNIYYYDYKKEELILIEASEELIS